MTDVAGLPLFQKPARYKDKAYYRLSDGDTEMSEQQLAFLEIQKKAEGRPSWDREGVEGTSIEDLDEDLVKQVVTHARRNSPRLARMEKDIDVLKAKNALTPSGNATVAGLYALGNYPQQYLPSLKATAAVQQPRTSGERLRNLKDFDGPLPEMVAGVVQWIQDNCSTSVVVDPETGDSRNVPEFPPVAIREIVTNAFVHRTVEPIMNSHSVEVRLTPDRLIIANPGGLWGISADRLVHRGDKSAVNMALYDLCKLLSLPNGARLIEGEGGGLPEAEAAMIDHGLFPPEFIDASVRFTVILRRQRAVSHQVSSRPQEVSTKTIPSERPIKRTHSTLESKIEAVSLNALTVYQAVSSGEATVSSIASKTGLPAYSVRYTLKKLLEEGFLEMVGGQGQRGTYYRPTHPAE